jgi:universal stress protein family protein
LNATRAPCSLSSREDDAAEALIELAEEQNGDLIVVGSRGLSAVERFLLGSVSQKVSQHAPTTVMVMAPTRFPSSTAPQRQAEVTPSSEPHGYHRPGRAAPHPQVRGYAVAHNTWESRTPSTFRPASSAATTARGWSRRARRRLRLKITRHPRQAP